jgi:hypothetical protein
MSQQGSEAIRCYSLPTLAEQEGNRAMWLPSFSDQYTEPEQQLLRLCALYTA